LDDLAHGLWSIANAIEAHAFQPPARQEILAAAARAVCKALDGQEPADLVHQMSTVKKEAQFAQYLRDHWLAGRLDKQGRLSSELEDALYENFHKALGKHAQFFSPKALKIEEQQAGNRYVGTGIQITLHKDSGFTQLRYVFPQGPAYKAGMRNGDLIVAVNGVSMKGLPLPKVVEHLRGDEGVPVSVDVRQPSERTARTLQMVRAKVPFETVVGYRRTDPEHWSYRVDPTLPIAYVRVDSLTSSAPHELRQIEARLSASGERVLVLDLRFASNDRMHEAALVADSLVDGGVLWQVRQAGNRIQEFRADRDCLFRDWPVVVLVNETTRGTPLQALALALKARRGATFVGAPARGDGRIESIIALPENLGALRLRTGRVEPASLQVREWAVQPDHLVVISTKKWEKVAQWCHQQQAPYAPSDLQLPAPADPQLAKAIQIAQQSLASKREKPKPRT
jgi:carboxyl-terminal processing protease